MFAISAGLAAYTVLAMCLTAVTKRTILPTGAGTGPPSSVCRDSHCRLAGIRAA